MSVGATGIWYSLSQLVQAIWNDTFLPFSARTVRTVRSTQQIDVTITWNSTTENHDITIATLFDHTRAWIVWQTDGSAGDMGGPARWLILNNTTVRFSDWNGAVGAPINREAIFTVNEGY